MLRDTMSGIVKGILNAGVVSEDGTFEFRGLRPGWYRLTIGEPPSESRPEVEFVDKLIELRDRDVDGLALAGEVSGGDRRTKFLRSKNSAAFLPR
jgi:hypothetical protein